LDDKRWADCCSRLATLSNQGSPNRLVIDIIFWGLVAAISSVARFQWVKAQPCALFSCARPLLALWTLLPFHRLSRRLAAAPPPESLNASCDLVLQALILVVLSLREHEKASAETWKLIQEAPSRISDLNRAVRDLKLSIPAGTTARQFNVRLVDKTMLLKVRNALGRRPSMRDGSGEKLGLLESGNNILADEAGIAIMDMVIGESKAVQILQQVLFDRVDLSLER